MRYVKRILLSLLTLPLILLIICIIVLYLSPHRNRQFWTDNHHTNFITDPKAQHQRLAESITEGLPVTNDWHDEYNLMSKYLNGSKVLDEEVLDEARCPTELADAVDHFFDPFKEDGITKKMIE